ncbi:TPA: glycosyl transferase 2 family protein, partial [Neisseria gonorrhoeae]
DICYKYIDKISNTKHQTPNTKHQTPNTKHQIPNIYIRITKDCRRREIPE